MSAPPAETAITCAQSRLGNKSDPTPDGRAVRRRTKSAPASMQEYSNVKNSPRSDYDYSKSPYIRSLFATHGYSLAARFSAMGLPVKPFPVAAAGVVTPIEDLDVYNHRPNDDYSDSAKRPYRNLSVPSASPESVNGTGNSSFESKTSDDTMSSFRTTAQPEQSLPFWASENKSDFDFGDAMMTDTLVPPEQVSAAVYEAGLPPKDRVLS